MSKLCIIHSDYPPLNYIIGGIEHPDIQTICLKRIRNTFWRSCMRRFCLMGGLWWSQRWRYIDKEALEQLSAIAEDFKVIVVDNKRMVVLRIIHKLLPQSTEKHLFYWTPICQVFHRLQSEKIVSRLSAISQMYCISSFNANDKAFYPNIMVKSTFYRFPAVSTVVNVKGEGLYFIGYEKGRTALLQRYKSAFEALGLPCSFLIYGRRDKGISYDENIERVARCQCIVDITIDQAGLSLRPLEALFFNKKLITNNKSIKQYPFYHPDNVFILEEDKMESLPSFVNKPLYTVSEEVKRSFDINNWALNY